MNSQNEWDYLKNKWGYDGMSREGQQNLERQWEREKAKRSNTRMVKSGHSDPFKLHAKWDAEQKAKQEEKKIEQAEKIKDERIKLLGEERYNYEDKRNELWKAEQAPHPKEWLKQQREEVDDYKQKMLDAKAAKVRAFTDDVPAITIQDYFKDPEGFQRKRGWTDKQIEDMLNTFYNSDDETRRRRGYDNILSPPKYDMVQTTFFSLALILGGISLSFILP